jgi:hypothetical protein
MELESAPHIVGGGHHRPASTGQALLDMALARRFGRVQQVPAFGLDRITAKLGTLQMSEATPQSSASRSAAAITSRRIVPLPSSCTRLALPLTALASWLSRNPETR